MATPTTAEIAALVETEQDRMVDVRRTLHRHPELSFLETDTTSLIDEHAAAIGLTKGFCPTDTGAVWTLDGGQPGRTVLIRADIDALPIVETAAIDFASEVEGVMHACGHDAHAAQLLGTAAALAARAEDLPGRYVFLFQPAEEALGGAIAMIDGGVLDHLGAEAVVGCHVASIAPVGLIGIKPGIAMSDSRKITIEASGVGGHGALYTGGADPIVAIALVATRLGGVVEGLELEGSHCACSAGILAAGTAPNVIPNHAHLEGTLRVFTPSHLDIVQSRIDDLLVEVAEESGCTLRVAYGEHAPAVVNDAGAAEVVRQTAAELLGERGVFAMPPTSPSDDVSEFLERIPGAYFFVGAGLADGSSGMHHNSSFAIDEACMPIAATVLASSAISLATPRA